MIKNLIDYIIIPREEYNVNIRQLTSIKKLFGAFDFSTSENWYSFTNKNIEIDISDTAIIMIAIKIPPEDTEKAIITLSKLSKKIRSVVSVDKFSTEIYILETQKIDAKLPSESINVELDPDIKISSRDKKSIISFKNCNDVKRIADLYMAMLNNEIGAII